MTKLIFDFEQVLKQLFKINNLTNLIRSQIDNIYEP